MQHYYIDILNTLSKHITPIECKHLWLKKDCLFELYFQASIYKSNLEFDYYDHIKLKFDKQSCKDHDVALADFCKYANELVEKYHVKNDKLEKQVAFCKVFGKLSEYRGLDHLFMHPLYHVDTAKTMQDFYTPE